METKFCWCHRSPEDSRVHVGQPPPGEAASHCFALYQAESCHLMTKTCRTDLPQMIRPSTSCRLTRRHHYSQIEIKVTIVTSELAPGSRQLIAYAGARGLGQGAPQVTLTFCFSTRKILLDRLACPRATGNGPGFCFLGVLGRIRSRHHTQAGIPKS